MAQISANFSIGPNQQKGVTPHTVDFIDKSTSTSPIKKWRWDFGDGGTADQPNPSHTYIQTGAFDVSLTVEDESGQKDTIVQPALVTVLPESPDLAPEDFRRFILVKSATNEVLAFGSQYPDLSCVLLWNGDPYHVLNYADIEDVAAAYLKPGQTALMWLDPVEEAMALEE